MFVPFRAPRQDRSAPVCEQLEPRKLFAASLGHQELHRPPRILFDVDGDQRDDLLVLSAHQSDPSAGKPAEIIVGVDVYINNGKGAFAYLGSADCDDGDPQADILAMNLAVGDVDGDGVADVVVKLLSQRTDPVTQVASPQLVACVLGGDGKGGFEQRGTFVIPHVLETSGKHYHSDPYAEDVMRLVVADVDGDGDGVADIISGFGDEIVITQMSKIGPRQSTSLDMSKVTVRGWDPKSKKEILGAADFTGDRLPELVVAAGDGLFLLSLDFDAATGAPSLGKVNKIEAITIKQTTRVALGDVDGDGLDDDLIIIDGNKLSVGINSTDAGGGVTFRQLEKLQAMPAGDILIGDVDGEVDDLVTLSNTSKSRHEVAMNSIRNIKA